jgi:hypothetical protein
VQRVASWKVLKMRYARKSAIRLIVAMIAIILPAGRASLGCSRTRYVTILAILPSSTMITGDAVVPKAVL